MVGADARIRPRVDASIDPYRKSATHLFVIFYLKILLVTFLIRKVTEKDHP